MYKFFSEKKRCYAERICRRDKKIERFVDKIIKRGKNRFLGRDDDKLEFNQRRPVNVGINRKYEI
jgi:phosphate uptake regulator